ncbi:hypothetical protein KP509_38G016100 [Ceratopteris richardii]|uniref:1-phosphatidylinositol 4-kinase n=1 Tax=Ceratopteris richardii TaxID=49495 RepID=A0A8T2Q2P6_CERRI|nr:hypothetical protein KP509_38G016100 [Ceratopteris richardii]KAH7277931.1 hypothetical protein KP509_38G016100 [Ceratopteris richardii]KAH7277932.1 hypothetical protein KP509_38G016100 [Ceratopteris richardii]
MASSAIILNPPNARGIMPSLGQENDLMEDIQIYLTTGANSSVIPLKIGSTDTIASVKMRIQACRGFYVKHQRLVFGGRELYRQDALVKDYGLTNGKHVHLVVKVSDLQVVTIKTYSGKEYTFTIDRMKSVRDLKHRLSMKETEYAAERQELMQKGQNLKDDMLIKQLSVGDDASVILFLRDTVKVKSHAVGTDIELLATSPQSDYEQFIAAKKTGKALLSSSQLVTKLDKLCVNKKNGVLVETFAKASPVLLDLVERVRSGLEQGHAPILAQDGSGGVYFMQDEYGSSVVGVFKPADEEPMAVNNPKGLPLSKSGEGLKRGTKVGEGALREVAAFILDHMADGQDGEKLTGFAGVPPTILVKCSYQCLRQTKTVGTVQATTKIGSLQMYVHARSNCEEMGPVQFPVHEVHKIAVLDIRLANTDRNGANILACKDKDAQEWRLVPIDHGYCLPDKFEDCTFEWLYWPQSKLPFQPETLKYISSLDADADILLLQKHGWVLSEGCARVLRVGTMLLKKGAAAGLSPFAIGSMMCREILNKVSAIEEMLEEAENSMLLGSGESGFMKALSAIVDGYIQKLLSKGVY